MEAFAIARSDAYGHRAEPCSSARSAPLPVGLVFGAFAVTWVAGAADAEWAAPTRSARSPSLQGRLIFSTSRAANAAR